MDVKNKCLNLSLIIATLYVILSLVENVVQEYTPTGVTPYDLILQNDYNYQRTYFGYYQPLETVIQNNKKKVACTPTEIPQEAMLYYIANEEPEKAIEVIKKIETIASEAASNASDDYGKVLEITKWVANNIYYDKDACLTHVGIDTINLNTILETKKTTCAGYSNILSAMLQTQGYSVTHMRGGVPIVSQGITYEDLMSGPTNHEWIAVELENRLMFIDVTWMSTNCFQEGKYYRGNFVRYDYFDMSFDAFCVEHRIDLVEKRDFIFLIEPE